MNYCNVFGCLNHAANGSLHCLHHISKAFKENASRSLKASHTPTEEVEVTAAATQVDEGFGVDSNINVTSTKANNSEKPSLVLLYPKYYKAVPKGWTVVDTYAVNILFPVDDPSGCILHARKKLLVPGVRSGGKSMRKDITEARDTLNRWLELNPE